MRSRVYIENLLEAPSLPVSFSSPRPEHSVVSLCLGALAGGEERHQEAIS